MNTTSKIHTIAIFGAVLALALMPVFVNSAYADNTDDLTSKIQKLQEKITSIQERSENLDLAEKKLIAKYKQKVVEYERIIVKADQKQKTQELFKSELNRLEAKEKFQDLHRQVYVAHDKDRGIHTDDTLVTALSEVVEKEDYSLVSAGLDKMINQYRDVEVRSQLQEYKTLVMDAMSELEEVDNKNTEVLALTTKDIKLPQNDESFGPENEIFNPEIIKTQLKQQIKTAVTSTKILADKISEDHKSKYQANKQITSVIDDEKPIDEYSKEKYQTKGVLKALDKLTTANEKAKAANDKVKDAKSKVSDAQNALGAAQAEVNDAEPDSKEYKDAVKALNKAQKNLNKAQKAEDKAQSNANKAAANAVKAKQSVDTAREKANEVAKKAVDKAVEKATKAKIAAQKAIDAATKAADKANTAQQKADDLATKASEAATAAEGADPDSKEAKKAQKAANQAQKAADAAQKASDAADKKQDQADTKKQQSDSAKNAVDKAVQFAA